MDADDRERLAPLAAQHYGRSNPKTRLVAEVVADTGGERSELEVLRALERVDQDFQFCHQLTNDEYKMHIGWAMEAIDDEQG